MSAEAYTTVQAERTVIGALLCDSTQLARIDLRADDFSQSNYRQTFELIRRMVAARETVDAVTVAGAFERQAKSYSLEEEPRLIELVAIQQDCLSPSNAPAYAAHVRRASRARKAAQIAERLSAGDDDAISNAIRDLIELSSVAAEHSCHVAEAIKLAADELEAISSGKSPGIRTGIRDLDGMLGGFHNEDLIVVGARPSMGKTAFMLNVACAAECGVGIISGEQGRTQIGMRLFAMEGPVSLHRMRTAKLDDEEWSRVASVMSIMQRRPLWIYDRPSPSIDDIVSQARVWKIHNNIGLLMVDYLQIIRGGRGQDFRLQVGDITQQLKDLGRELKIPVVALAQVKREVESRQMGEDGLGRMPYMADIAESAIIEQIADQIGTLYRPEVYDDIPQYKGLAYFNACKNRHGPVGHKALSWRGEYLKFGDLARTEMAHQDRWSVAS